MLGSEYQELAMRTNDGNSTNRMLKSIGTIKQYSIGGLLNGILGLTGEAGEVADLVKKGIFHEHGIDEEHLKKEIGDVMWYIAMICDSCDLDLNEIMQINIDKLRARYPEGFDAEMSKNRKKGDI